jgi:N-terminal acetyltransferase B complex non-catalytic subunit
LKANDATTQPTLRPVLFKLAHRLISSAHTPSFASADRFFVHLTILKELELWDDATVLLSSDIGQTISNTNLTIDEIRRDIWRAKGSVQEEGERAQQRIQEREYVERSSLTYSDCLIVLYVATVTGSNSFLFSTERSGT